MGLHTHQAAVLLVEAACAHVQERSHFLRWRRELASLEQDERLVLTPFEKNLEVWRQLWRVLERSDVVVQVRPAVEPRVQQAFNQGALACTVQCNLKAAASLAGCGRSGPAHLPQ